MKIFVAVDLPDSELDRIRQAAPGHTVIARACRTHDDLAAHFDPQTEVLLARFGLPTPELAPSLAWVQTFGAGVDHLRSQPLTRTNVRVTTASGIHAVAIAELIFAFVLYFQRSLAKAQSYKAERRWVRPDTLFTFFERPDLTRQVLCLVGFGAIGRQTARIAAAFGMKVVAVCRNPERAATLRYDSAEPPDIPAVGLDRLHEALAQSDYVVISLPLTQSTHHCIDRDALAAMKPTAILINVGRGAVLDEQALVKALRERHIAGAALDVFEQEPLPKDHPFYELDNVLLTPHVAGAIRDYDRGVVDVFTTNLRRYLSSEPLLNQVDWTHEY